MKKTIRRAKTPAPTKKAAPRRKVNAGNKEGLFELVGKSLGQSFGTIGKAIDQKEAAQAAERALRLKAQQELDKPVSPPFAKTLVEAKTKLLLMIMAGPAGKMNGNIAESIPSTGGSLLVCTVLNNITYFETIDYPTFERACEAAVDYGQTQAFRFCQTAIAAYHKSKEVKSQSSTSSVDQAMAGVSSRQYSPPLPLPEGAITKN